MNELKTIFFTLILAFSFAGIYACPDRNDGPAENIGEQIDDAAEDAGDKIEDIGDKAEDAVDESGNK